MTIFAAMLLAATASAQDAQLPSIECDKAHAKDCAPPPPQQQTSRPPSTAEKFPFPGEPASDIAQPPQSSPAQQPAGSTANRFPFPGETADTPTAPEDAPAPQAPSSSSSGLPPTTGEDGMSSSSSSQDGEPAPTTQSDDTPVTASPLPNFGSRRSKAEEEGRRRNEENRVPDDLKIGKFYSDDGNWNGAYLRYKDAAEHDPEEPEAQYGWALAAEKLNKPDEARQHYLEYLKLDPSAEHAREARRALNQLGSGGSRASQAGKR